MDFNNFEGFEWDVGNINKNWDKHNITNTDAEQIFFNEPILITEDKRHSTDKEKRYVVFGLSNTGRKLTAIFTIRNNLIRIISARQMSLKERSIFNEEAKENT